MQSLSSGFLVAAGLGPEIPSQSNYFQTLGFALCPLAAISMVTNLFYALVLIDFAGHCNSLEISLVPYSYSKRSIYKCHLYFF